MDILPAQGSAVSSERVFSSARRTITDERNRLLSEHVEMLQILKYSLKSQRLDFSERWLATEEESRLASVYDELEAALKARDSEAVNLLLNEFI